MWLTRQGRSFANTRRKIRNVVQVVDLPAGFNLIGASAGTHNAGKHPEGYVRPWKCSVPLPAPTPVTNVSVSRTVPTGDIPAMLCVPGGLVKAEQPSTESNAMNASAAQPDEIRRVIARGP